MTREQYLRRKKRKRRQRKIALILCGLAAALLFVGLLVWKGLFSGSSGSGGTKPATVAPTPTSTPTSTPSPTPSPSPTPTPTPTPNVVNMVAVGDNLYDWYMLEDGYNREDKTFDFSHNYDYIKRYAQMADFAVVNQETPIGGDGGYTASGSELKNIGEKQRWGSYHGYAQFNTPDEVGHELVKAGFNVITSATNHSSDFGWKALKNTIEFWKQYPDVTVLGIHESEEDQQTIRVLKKYDISIACLNYTYGLNLDSALKEAPYSIDKLSKDRVTKDVEKAKQMADFVVVFVHWGDEYKMTANSYQKEYTKLFLKLGVDAVVGAHPHICEPMEWLTGEDGHRMVVYYSLGNFLSMFKKSECELEGMAYLEFFKDENGKSIREGTIIPLVNHWNYDSKVYGKRKNFRVYALQDYTDELGAEHGSPHYGDGQKKFSNAYMKELATKLWGDNIKVVDWSTTGKSDRFSDEDSAGENGAGGGDSGGNGGGEAGNNGGAGGNGAGNNTGT